MSQHDTHADAITALDDIENAIRVFLTDWELPQREAATLLLPKVAAARATIAALQARCDAGEALAFEAHEVTESWAEGHVTGMVELSLAVRAYYAALRASQPTTESA